MASFRNDLHRQSARLVPSYRLTLVAIPALVDPTHSHHPQPIYLYTTRVSQIVYIRSQPTPIIQFPHVITSLVIPAYDQRQDRSYFLAGVVLVECT
jgi:hypothetical protein